MLRIIFISAGVTSVILLFLTTLLVLFKNELLIMIGAKRKPLSREEFKVSAEIAGSFLMEKFKIFGAPVGVVLGTGFGDKLKLKYAQSIPFSQVPGFSNINKLAGHNRKFIYGKIGGTWVLALQGRIHANENLGNPEVDLMLCLQTEVLMAVGVRKLIVTCAAGALPESNLNPGDLVLVDSLLTVAAPPMPLTTGEFVSPEDVLSESYRALAMEKITAFSHLVLGGCYAMIRGPFFEGRKKDKLALAMLGANLVGMSILPELCIAAIYEAKVLVLAFITNGWSEEHSHESNVEEAQKSSDALSAALEQIIRHS